MIYSPGRVVRSLAGGEVEMIRWIARHYVENAARYRTEVKRLDQPGRNRPQPLHAECAQP